MKKWAYYFIIIFSLLFLIGGLFDILGSFTRYTKLYGHPQIISFHFSIMDSLEPIVVWFGFVFCIFYFTRKRIKEEFGKSN